MLLDPIAIAPFAAVILSLALMPAIAPHLWESPVKRALWLLVPTLVAAARAGFASHPMGESLAEYAAFLALLVSLYGVAGGIVLRPRAAPGVATNTSYLAAGAVLASVMGTTGASMLLVRPFCQAQAGRRYARHTVVFFILLVSNVGGMLTPLGDPPLYLGFLRGVPFTWTLYLAPAWALGTSMLLAQFAALDAWAWRRESVRPAAPTAKTDAPRVQGWHNVGLFGLLVATIALGPVWGLGQAAQSCALLGWFALSYFSTPAALYRTNGVTTAPMVEVATVFLAIFITMPSALGQLIPWAAAQGALGAESFFWLTGALSAVLDNAPCYLSFAAMAATQCGLGPTELGALAMHPEGQSWLIAISEGAVMMGALTYIGNGPNLMVRAVAVSGGLMVPTFFGYVAWAALTLGPVLVAVRLILG